MKKFLSSLIVGTAALLLMQSVFADEHSVGKRERPLSIGLGVVYSDKPYRGYSSDEKYQPIPVVLYEGQHFFARGTTIGWDFLDSDVLELAIIGRYLGDGYDESDSTAFRGNGDRNPSFGMGGQVTWKPNKLGFQFSAVQDVIDNSDGAQIVGDLFYTHRTGPWMIKPSVAVVWQSEDYNDYYYGVRPAAVNAAPYNADSDFNYRLGVFGVYQQANSNWSFMGRLGYEFLGDEITDSTIVNEDEQFSAMIGVAYTIR
jgi:outer membrane protein